VCFFVLFITGSNIIARCVYRKVETALTLKNPVFTRLLFNRRHEARIHQPDEYLVLGGKSTFPTLLSKVNTALTPVADVYIPTANGEC
jgi:hypothetical protein